MEKSQGYEDLLVWKVGIELAEEVYRLTATFPKNEQYGLAGQLQRSAVSIPSNIAEGWGRGEGASNLNHAKIARGSLYELKTQLHLASKIGIGDTDSTHNCLKTAERLRHILQAYVKAMQSKQSRNMKRSDELEGGAG